MLYFTCASIKDCVAAHWICLTEKWGDHCPSKISLLTGSSMTKSEANRQKHQHYRVILRDGFHIAGDIRRPTNFSGRLMGHSTKGDLRR